MGRNGFSGRILESWEGRERAVVRLTKAGYRVCVLRHQIYQGGRG